MKKKHLLILILMVAGALAQAQTAIRITLPQVLELARNQSIASRQAATTRETKYWEYRTFQSDYKPQLTLTSNFPAYSRTFQQVVQPDGTIVFQPVRNNNSSVGLALSQNIAQTGGSVYAQTQLQRFDDFDRKSTLYNGALLAVGISQPLFRFNPFKWENKIAPLIYNESRQAYLESLESITLNANQYFFDLLLAQANLKISETNLSNTEAILKIAREKFDIGKTSRNEILQLQLENLKARKAVVGAKRDMEISTLNLKAYIGLQNDAKLELAEPTVQTDLSISADRLLSEAFENRSDAVAFTRRLLESEREVARAKGNNGLNAALTANLGFSNSDARIDRLISSPQNQQLLLIEFTLPVLDWGRSQARMKTAEANRQLAVYSVEQDKQNLKQEIFTQVTLFDMLKTQLILNAQADSIASEKYQIAQERYVLGNLSITDLSIAFAENDQAKRDYVGALRDYWTAFYRLRRLTLYDFEKREKIR